MKKLLEQRDAIMNKIQEIPLWVNGSVIETVRKHKGSETPFNYLSRSINGKNKVTYISSKDLNNFKTAARSGLKLKRLLSELNEVNIQILKIGSKND